MNSELNTELRDRFAIRKYPTIIVLAKGKLYEYKGDRTFEAINNFIKRGYLEEQGELIPFEISLFRLITKSFGKVLIVLVFLSLTFFALYLLCQYMNKEEDENTLLNISDNEEDEHEKVE